MVGRPVSALDTIESGERWRKSNLTDGIAPATLSAEEKAELERTRDALRQFDDTQA
jgi:hypothetical protein